jgi:putative SOS response-associated peptidase YedK
VTWVHRRVMTRCYCLDRPSHEIAVAFDAHQGPDPWGRGNLLPGEFAPVVIQSQKTQQRVIRPMVWGYPAPDGIAPNGDVNWVPTVRNVDSPFWIGNLRHSELRCLVPATAFLLRAKGREYTFALPDQPLFAMAGIWRDLTDMPVFAIITTDAGGLAHEAGANAMPVILETDQIDRWLRADWKDARQLAAPYSGALTRCA